MAAFAATRKFNTTINRLGSRTARALIDAIVTFSLGNIDDEADDEGAGTDSGYGDNCNVKNFLIATPVTPLDRSDGSGRITVINENSYPRGTQWQYGPLFGGTTIWDLDTIDTNIGDIDQIRILGIG